LDREEERKKKKNKGVVLKKEFPSSWGRDPQISGRGL